MLSGQIFLIKIRLYEFGICGGEKNGIGSRREVERIKTDKQDSRNMYRYIAFDAGVLV